LFHAIVQERKKFGPIGWNIAYEFTYEDMICSRRQFKLFLEEYDVIPFKVLNIVTADINYGGRVTDDKDVILINTILKLYLCPEAMEVGYHFSESGLYKQTEPGLQCDYLNYLDTLPLNPAPEAFGLHDNAAITNAQNETMKILSVVTAIQPKEAGGSGKSREEIIEDIAVMIESRLPTLFDEIEVQKKYQVSYEESMNTVLLQEVEKYNKLLKGMVSSLKNVKKALKGMIVMDEMLEALSDALFDQQVPVVWSGVFLSLKPLTSWIADLQRRVTFLKDWVEFGEPNIYWISGFSFPQAFLTGTMQNAARRKGIAIDKLTFDYKWVDSLQVEDVKEKPSEGIYVHGLFIEGAKWHTDTHEIGQPLAKELYSGLPILHLIPTEDRVKPERGLYNCPLYRVTSRTGVLKTSGHSTNFVMFAELPTVLGKDVWIRAGVASFLALRY